MVAQLFALNEMGAIVSYFPNGFSNIKITIKGIEFVSKVGPAGRLSIISSPSKLDLPICFTNTQPSVWGKHGANLKDILELMSGGKIPTEWITPFIKDRDIVKKLRLIEKIFNLT